jgi:hypothetical protein
MARRVALVLRFDREIRDQNSSAGNGKPQQQFGQAGEPGDIRGLGGLADARVFCWIKTCRIIRKGISMPSLISETV